MWRGRHRAIADVTRATREREPGSLIRFDLIRDASEPDRFFAYEVWRDVAAFAAHQQADHYRRFGERTAAWLAEPPVVHCAGTNAYPPDHDAAWRQEGRMDPVEPMGIRFADDSLPAGYDRIFTPRLFEPWADVLLDLVGIRTGDAVLDVATGPGTVARLAAARAAGSGRVAGIDISAPMLALARQKAPRPARRLPELQRRRRMPCRLPLPPAHAASADRGVGTDGRSGQDGCYRARGRRALTEPMSLVAPHSSQV